MANPPAETDRPVTLADLENQTRTFDDSCVKIEELVAALETDLAAVKHKHLPALKRQVGVVARQQAELESMVLRAGHLFVKPRTIPMNGVKVGFQVSAGRIVWDDAAQVVALIREKHKKEADTLIQVTEEPRKSALKILKAEELAEIGCRIEGAGDQVVLARVAGDVEKLVNKLVEKMVAAMTEDG